MKHRTAGTPPVHTFMQKEPLVFNGHRRLPEMVGHILQIHPDTVLFSVNRLKLYPITGLFVLIINDRAELHGIIIRIHLQNRGQRRINVLHKKSADHCRRTDTDQHHGKQAKENSADDPSGKTLFPFSRLACLLSFVLQERSSFLLNYKSCLHFSKRPTIHQNIYFIVSPSVNIENVCFCRKKVV